MDRIILFFIAVHVAVVATAGSLSSLSVAAYHDNSEGVAARVVDGDGAVSISLAGDWFKSGECELFVDGVRVATSDGALSFYSLEGAEDTWKSYYVTLKSEEGEISKVVTLFPSAGYKCAMHSLSREGNMLDSHPAGTIRKVRFGMEIPVAWSTMWSEGAEGVSVSLYSGYGAAGEKLNELVDVDGQGEGIFVLASKVAPLKSGLYTLTHFDGVETLTAYLSVRSGGTVVVLR
jgi:hypothetical protein